MAETIQPASQADLAATTLTAVYTVPALTRAVVSSITVCNRNAAAITYRLSIAVAGAADDPKQYFAYDVTLAGNSTDTWTIGATLGAADVVRAFASGTGVSVQVFKSELT